MAATNLPLNAYLVGLEPETQKVFALPHSAPSDARDVDRAIRHSMAVSAAKGSVLAQFQTQAWVKEESK